MPLKLLFEFYDIGLSWREVVLGVCHRSEVDGRYNKVCGIGYWDAEDGEEGSLNLFFFFLIHFLFSQYLRPGSFKRSSKNCTRYYRSLENL